MDEPQPPPCTGDRSDQGESTVVGRPYRLPMRPMGLRPGVGLTKALQLAAALEDEVTLRNLERRG